MLPVTFGCAGPVLSAAERAFFAEARPWGFILFARNVETPEQLMRLTQEMRDAVGRDAPVLIDQEGGRVQRMGPPYWRQWRPPLDILAQARDPADARRMLAIRGRLIAAELISVGIDVNCAPLADIARPATHPILRNRLYGEAADAVAERARAMAEGMLAGGVLPVVKHIPGHGRASRDSHVELPRVDTARDELEATDFAPFRALADLPLGMTAHVVYAAIDPRGPATVSPVMIRLIREALSFEGLLTTDDISMEALAGDVAARGRAALAAGCDIVLHCNGEMAEMEALAATLPPMSPAALERWARAEARRARPAALDVASLEAELAVLTGELRDA